MDEYTGGFDDLRVRFVFVPDSVPVPWDWMADWAEIVRVPATLVLRSAAEDAEGGEHLQEADHAAPNTSAVSSAVPDSPSDRPEYRSYAPRASDRRGRQLRGGSVALAALGDLRCEGFPAGCSGGGSYGMTAMFGILGKKLCSDCAVRILGIEGEPSGEKTKILRPYLLNDQ